MAEAVAVAAPVAESTGAGGKKKMKLLVLAVVAIVVGAVGAKMFLLTGDAEAGPPPPPEEGAVVTIGEMTTSLAGSGAHYARVEIAAVTNAAADAASLEAAFPLMRDQALTVLMGFTAEQLRTVEGANQLRDALTEKAQGVWEEQEVLRIVLTDLLVQ